MVNRDFEEYMRITLGYIPEKNDRFVNPYNNLQLEEDNSAIRQKEDEQEDSVRKDVRPLDSAPIKPKLEENRSIETSINNNANKVRRNVTPVQQNRRNAPATSYKNFLKF